MILVSNETSMGIVPMGELSRRFCDESGLLHQTLAGTLRFCATHRGRYAAHTQTDQRLKPLTFVKMGKNRRS